MSKTIVIDSPFRIGENNLTDKEVNSKQKSVYCKERIKHYSNDLNLKITSAMEFQRGLLLGKESENDSGEDNIKKDKIKKKFRSVGSNKTSNLIDQMNNFISNYDELMKLVEVKQEVGGNCLFNNQINNMIASKVESREIRLKDSPLKNFISTTENKIWNLEENFKLVNDDVQQLVCSIKPSLNNLNSKTKCKNREIKEFYEYSKDCLYAIRDLNFPKFEELKDYMIDLPFSKEELKEKKIAIFDLDETLVHCESKDNDKAQILLPVTMTSGHLAQVGINIRPYAIESLREISKDYIVVVFTASHKNYADAVLNYLDPQEILFRMRLYRNNCIRVKMDEDFVYVKDLRIFRNLDLSRTVIIDNSILSFSFHLNNGIPILPYHDNLHDNELLHLVTYLKFLNQCIDIREENVKNFDLENFFTNSLNNTDNTTSSPLSIHSASEFNISIIDESLNSSLNEIKA